MKQITLSLPFNIEEEEAKLYLAIKLFEEGRISLGQASKLAGYSKRAFMEILGKHGVPVFDYPAEELERDLEIISPQIQPRISSTESSMSGREEGEREEPRRKTSAFRYPSGEGSR